MSINVREATKEGVDLQLEDLSHLLSPLQASYNNMWLAESSETLL
jgi:hypothetical protein